MKDEAKPADSSAAFNLKKAAISGAAVGALVPLLNSLQGQVAGTDMGSMAFMMAGSALGGAVLFVFIGVVRNALLR